MIKVSVVYAVDKAIKKFTCESVVNGALYLELKLSDTSTLYINHRQIDAFQIYGEESKCEE